MSEWNSQTLTNVEFLALFEISSVMACF